MVKHVQEKKHRRKRLSLKRLVTFIIGIILLTVGAISGILNIQGVIQGHWTDILSLILFPALGLAISLLAWFIPPSSDRSEVPQLPLACELNRESFRMGDDTAANFTYITTPIQDAYNSATQVLHDANTRVGTKRGILILGEANSGKTRLAFEALSLTLPNWPVLRWRPDSTIDKVPFSERQLVIFIDDLQDYVSTQKDRDGRVFTDDRYATTLRTLLEISRQEVQCVVVVATCRIEDEGRVRIKLGQLFTELETLWLLRFNVDIHDPKSAQIIADFQRHGSTHIQDWDGTLGSLVLGLSTKNHEYLKIQNDPAATVLRAMKLLRRANTLVHTERRLRAVCADVFGEKALLTDVKAWREAVNLLTQEQFVTEEVDQDSREMTLVIRKDTYFDQVITDYAMPNRPHQLQLDFTRLQNTLMALGDADALANLGLAFNVLGEIALDCQELMQAEDCFNKSLRIAQSANNRQEMERALSNLGQLALFRMKLNEAENYYRQSIAHCQEAGDTAGEAWNVNCLGEVVFNRGRLDEAERNYRQSLEIWHEAARKAGKTSYTFAEGIISSNISRIALCRGQLDEAEEGYRHSIMIRHAVKDRRGEAWDNACLGEIALLRGNLDEAEKRFKSSLDMCDQVQYWSGKAVLLSYLGKMALLQGDLDKAEFYCQRSLPICREKGDWRGEGWDLLYLGQIAEQRGELDEAERFYRESLAIRRVVSIDLDTANSLLHLGCFLHEKRGKREEGCLLLAEAVHLYPEQWVPGLADASGLPIDMSVPGKEQVRRRTQALGCPV